MPKGYINASYARKKTSIKVQDFCDFLNAGVIKTISQQRSINSKNLQHVFVEEKSLKAFENNLRNKKSLFRHSNKNPDFNFNEAKKYIILESECSITINKLNEELTDCKKELAKISKKYSHLINRYDKLRAQASDLIKFTIEFFNDSKLNTKNCLTRKAISKKCLELNLTSVLQTKQANKTPRERLKPDIWKIIQNGFRKTGKLYKLKTSHPKIPPTS